MVINKYSKIVETVKKERKEARRMKAGQKIIRVIGVICGCFFTTEKQSAQR